MAREKLSAVKNVGNNGDRRRHALAEIPSSCKYHTIDVKLPWNRNEHVYERLTVRKLEVAIAAKCARDTDGL